MKSYDKKNWMRVICTNKNNDKSKKKLTPFPLP